MSVCASFEVGYRGSRTYSYILKNLRKPIGTTSLLRNLESLKHSYQLINEFTTRKTEVSDLETHLDQILAFFCQCVQLEKTLLASGVVTEESISDSFLRRPTELNVGHGMIWVELMKICEALCNLTNNYILNIRHSEHSICPKEPWMKQPPYTEFGGVLIVDIPVSLFHPGDPTTTRSKRIISPHEILWNKENPFRHFHFRPMGVGRPFGKLQLFNLIERCVEVWEDFLKKHGLLHENSHSRFITRIDRSDVC